MVYQTIQVGFLYFSGTVPSLRRLLKIVPDKRGYSAKGVSNDEGHYPIPRHTVLQCS